MTPKSLQIKELRTGSIVKTLTLVVIEFIRLNSPHKGCVDTATLWVAHTTTRGEVVVKGPFRNAGKIFVTIFNIEPTSHLVKATAAVNLSLTLSYASPLTTVASHPLSRFNPTLCPFGQVINILQVHVHPICPTIEETIHSNTHVPQPLSPFGSQLLDGYPGTRGDIRKLLVIYVHPLSKASQGVSESVEASEARSTGGIGNIRIVGNCIGHSLCSTSRLEGLSGATHIGGNRPSSTPTGSPGLPRYAASLGRGARARNRSIYSTARTPDGSYGPTNNIAPATNSHAVGDATSMSSTRRASIASKLGVKDRTCLELKGSLILGSPKGGGFIV